MLSASPLSSLSPLLLWLPSRSLAQIPCESLKSFLGKWKDSFNTFLCCMVQSAGSSRGRTAEQPAPALYCTVRVCFSLESQALVTTPTGSKHASRHQRYWQLAWGRFPDTWLSAGAAFQSSPLRSACSAAVWSSIIIEMNSESLENILASLLHIMHMCVCTHPYSSL